MTKKYKFLPVDEATYKKLLKEKHKRSISAGKTITWDTLLKEAKY